jgi:DNA-binding CsgD family transcriptional regulator
VDHRLTSIPRWVGAHSERVLDARGDPERLMAVFNSSRMPMVMVDDERRYVDANPPARDALSLSLKELRRLRMDDVTPRYLWPEMERSWERLRDVGSVMSSDVAPRRRNYLGMTYYAVANVLPDRHLVAFAPAGWREADADPDGLGGEPAPHLTRRELEVLQLAAGGLNGPGVAKALVLSTATVRTHFGHIYRKLEVTDRAGAVAKAMRLGLIR